MTVLFIFGFLLGLFATIGVAASVYLIPADEPNRSLLWVSALGLAAILAPVIGVVTGTFIVRRRMSR